MKCALRLGELHKVVQSLESRSVPGFDGIPIDFNKRFWEALREDLLDVLNGSLDEGLLFELPESLTEIKNWRPVSLVKSQISLMFSKQIIKNYD